MVNRLRNEIKRLIGRLEDDSEKLNSFIKVYHDRGDTVLEHFSNGKLNSVSTTMSLLKDILERNPEEPPKPKPKPNPELREKINQNTDKLFSSGAFCDLFGDLLKPKPKKKPSGKRTTEEILGEIKENLNSPKGSKK